MAAERLLPVTDDHDTAGFFELAMGHELGIRMCSDCGRVLHVPIAYCRHCGSWSTVWAPVPGRGRLHSWTVVTHQVHPAYPTPYTVVLVDLDEHLDVRMVGMLAGTPTLAAGQPMEVWFEDVDDVVLPQWRPARPAD